MPPTREEIQFKPGHTPTPPHMADAISTSREGQDDDDENDADRAQDKSYYDKLGRELTVFCLSARAYMKLTGKLSQDPAILGFDTDLFDGKISIPPARRRSARLARKGQWTDVIPICDTSGRPVTVFGPLEDIRSLSSPDQRNMVMPPAAQMANINGMVKADVAAQQGRLVNSEPNEADGPLPLSERRNTVQSMRVILEALESLELPLEDVTAVLHILPDHLVVKSRSSSNSLTS
ncbi:hypothetical protein CONLIGDRAFT_702743 [Coniochaeta ligniaria NRRL 30616]|uniref:Uncharacterized protein n=1 Tax=Coniochaeta ligniaria NRRL 30616 TaxID=1408157 RepID=A0A1J7JLK4_9PEZI|nr:hypothetical protein CONLIGDRAFT_702743 [Coniochaeta ligniaria NRRL 30616]